MINFFRNAGTLASLVLLVACGSGSSNNSTSSVSKPVQVINNTPNDIASVQIVDSTNGNILFSSAFDCASKNTNCYVNYPSAKINGVLDFIFFNDDKDIVAAYILDEIVSGNQVDIELNQASTGIYIVNQLKKHYPKYGSITQAELNNKILTTLKNFTDKNKPGSSVLPAVNNAYSSMVVADSGVTPKVFADDLHSYMSSNKVKPYASFLSLNAQTADDSGCSTGFKSLIDFLNLSVKFADSVVPGGKQVSIIFDSILKYGCTGSASSVSNQMLKEQLDQMYTAIKNLNGNVWDFKKAWADTKKWESYYNYDKLEDAIAALEQDLQTLKDSSKDKTLLGYVQEVGGSGPDGLTVAIQKGNNIASLSKIMTTVIRSNEDGMYSKIMNLPKSNLNALITQLNSVCGDKDTIEGNIIGMREKCNLTILTLMARTLNDQKRVLAIFKEVYSVLAQYKDVSPQYSYNPSLSADANLSAVTKDFVKSQEQFMLKIKGLPDDTDPSGEVVGVSNQQLVDGKPAGLYNVFAQLPSVLLPSSDAGFTLACFNQEWTADAAKDSYTPSYYAWFREGVDNEYLETNCWSITNVKRIKSKYTIKTTAASDYEKAPFLLNLYGVIVNGKVPIGGGYYTLESSTGDISIPRFDTPEGSLTNSFFIPEFGTTTGSLKLNNDIQRGGRFGFIFKDAELSDSFMSSIVRYVDPDGYAYMFALTRSNYQNSNYKNVSKFGLSCMTKDCSYPSSGELRLTYGSQFPSITFSLSHLGEPWYFSVNGSPQTQ